MEGMAQAWAPTTAEGPGIIVVTEISPSSDSSDIVSGPDANRQRGKVLTDHAIVILATVKGLIMAMLITTIIDASFIQTMIVAITSATVSGAFLLISTTMNSKRTDQKVEEVREHVAQDVRDGES
jgi:undecaprenyl pyrophosphate phosphatase UppP